MPHHTPYSDRIRTLAPDFDPRHVEAYMRDFLGTLDHLSPAQFRAEVRLAAACTEENPAAAERLALSYGL